MKRMLFIIAGALLLLGIGVLATLTLSHWAAASFVHSDDDMNTIGKILFLGVYPALVVIGGWLGNFCHRRTLAAR